MKKFFVVLMLLAILILSIACSANKTSNEITITVAAAASLTNPMNQIIDDFEKNNPNYNIIVNFASSGSLLKQIQEGAPIDIFLSASTSKFNPLLGELISEKNSQLLLSNSMSLITYKDKVLSESEYNKALSNFTRFTYSIGDPDSVPAGKYAYEVLNKLELWTENNENQITAKSVRQVLNYVESHNVEYGIVYSSDAYNNENVKVINEFDNKLHSPINYPIGIIDTSVSEENMLFYNYLISDDAMKVFEEFGFKDSQIK